MAARKTGRKRRVLTKKIRHIPEIPGVNAIPSLFPDFDYLMTQIRTELRALRDSGYLTKEVIPMFMEQERTNVLYFEGLQKIVDDMIIPDDVASKISALYFKQLPLFEKSLLNALLDIGSIWFEGRNTGFAYVVYSDGRCMKCLQENRRFKGWKKTQFTKIRDFKDYETLREQIPKEWVLDERLEEVPEARLLYAPMCDIHKEKSTLLTLGHRIITTEPPCDLVEARLKSGAGIAPKITEYETGGLETYVDRGVIDDLMAARCRAKAPRVWERTITTLDKWSPKGRFGGRLNVKGYKAEEIDESIREAIRGSKHLEKFYERRIQPNMVVLGRSEEEEAKFFEAVLPIDTYGNAMTIHIYEEEEYKRTQERKDRRSYNIEKEQRINREWSPLAIAVLMRFIPIIVLPMLQDYAFEVRKPAIERFKNQPLHVLT